MAYDADGNWIAEDDTVESRVTGVLAKGSPLITQAQTAAKQEAIAQHLGIRFSDGTEDDGTMVH